MIKSRGTVFSHIIYTMIIFSLLNFVAFSSFIGEGINQQLIGHGTNIVLNAIFIIQVIIANIFQTDLPVASRLNPIQPFIGTVPVNTIFALSSALYLYMRLFGRHTIDKVETDGINAQTFLNMNNLGRISITLIFAILLNFTIIGSVATVIKTVSLMIVSSFIIIILFYSYQWRKELS